MTDEAAVCPVLSSLPLLAFIETGFVRWEISLW